MADKDCKMAVKYIKMADLRAMSDEGLIRISCERNSRNKLSINAENAMRVRKERSGSAYWKGVSNHAPSFAKQEFDYEGYGKKRTWQKREREKFIPCTDI